MRTGRWLVPMALAIVLVAAPSVALAQISGRIVENVGIKTAKLGLHDTTDAHRLRWSYKRIVDKDYAIPVYCYFFGAKSKTTGKYPLEMYSKKSNRHVFTFIVNTPALVTSNKTHVGTTEAALESRYGSRVTRHTTSTYTYYRMGTSRGLTEFWCKSGKVAYIVIARY